MTRINSTIVDKDDVSEEVVDGLIDQLGKMPTSNFDVQIIVTVIVTPLPEESRYTKFSRDLWSCWG